MKKVFSYNEDISKTAYMNWRTNSREPIHNMNVLAKGYLQAAIELARCCLDDNSDNKADVIVFPMLFSLNQGIELYEKAIYWSMNILLGYSNIYPDNHKIREIWYADKEKIKKFGFDEREGRGEKEFHSMVFYLEKYLDEVYEKICKNDSIDFAFHNIDFTRYPLNNRNEEHFYVTELDNVVIDLEYILLVATKVGECLERLSEYYYGLVLEKWQKYSWLFYIVYKSVEDYGLCLLKHDEYDSEMEMKLILEERLFPL